MISTTAREAVAVVEQQVRRQRHLTLTEAAALTGLAIDEAREALDVLLKHYVCRLQVSEHGDVIYNFGATLRRRGSITLTERLQAIGTWLRTPGHGRWLQRRCRSCRSIWTVRCA
jgi:hypothetical protein